MKFKKRSESIKESRQIEDLKAIIAKQQAVIEYLSIMTDIELPYEEEEMNYESESGTI